MGSAIKLSEAGSLSLPTSLVGASDISRCLQELEALDNDLNTQVIRNSEAGLTIPPMSRALSEFVSLNTVDLGDPMARMQAVAGLRTIKQKAPTIQLTFAAEPDQAVAAQLVTWIRENIHADALLTFGLQPALVSGCVVRTPDHIYDFSMRGRFNAALPSLIQELNTASA